MTPEITQLKNLRSHIISITEQLTDEQLNAIPAPFTNNIIWNIAHLLASQQRICYLRSGNPFFIDEFIINKYKIETKPELAITAEEINTIRKLFIDSIDQLAIDYENKVFKTYTSWVTPYGVAINSIDDAIKFLPFHEGLHTGTILALKKFV